MNNLIKPCPFCGNKNVYIRRAFGVTSARCDYCGAVVSFRGKDNELGVRAVWNRRVNDNEIN